MMILKQPSSQGHCGLTWVSLLGRGYLTEGIFLEFGTNYIFRNCFRVGPDSSWSPVQVLELKLSCGFKFSRRATAELVFWTHENLSSELQPRPLKWCSKYDGAVRSYISVNGVVTSPSCHIFQKAIRETGERALDTGQCVSYLINWKELKLLKNKFLNQIVLFFLIALIAKTAQNSLATLWFPFRVSHSSITRTKKQLQGRGP